MKTAYLRTFIEVVNLKSFSKAAEKLYLSQPAVTKQIKFLEKEFGVVLLERSYNDVIATDSGKEFYKYAATVLNKEEALYAKFKNVDETLSGELTVFASSIPANYLLDKWIMDFGARYEQVRFDIHKTDSKKVYDEVESGRTPFGFTGMKKKSRGIECVEIAKDELVLAVSGDRYKELDGKSVDLGFLLEQEFIIRDQDSATLKTFEEAMKREAYSIKDFKIKAIVDDNEIIKKLIIRGLGVSVMSRLSIEHEVRQGSIIPVKINGIDLNRLIYFIYQKNRYISGVEAKFVDFILHKQQLD